MRTGHRIVHAPGPCFTVSGGGLDVLSQESRGGLSCLVDMLAGIHGFEDQLVHLPACQHAGESCWQRQEMKGHAICRERDKGCRTFDALSGVCAVWRVDLSRRRGISGERDLADIRNDLYAQEPFLKNSKDTIKSLRCATVCITDNCARVRPCIGPVSTADIVQVLGCPWTVQYRAFATCVIPLEALDTSNSSQRPAIRSIHSNNDLPSPALHFPIATASQQLAASSAQSKDDRQL
jgi:hypothetical protein